MKQYDVVVIGGGVLGCFVARNLRRWQMSVALLEGEADVCTGITRANSAIVYPGYDNKPGSLKAALTVGGNANFDQLCEELEVPFSRCGSLLVTYDPAARPRLKRKLQHGLDNGVPGLQLLEGAEAEAMEPMLRPGVVCALYAPTTGTVNPWQLGIAACENAVNNGAALFCNAKVEAITPLEDGYRVETGAGVFSCQVVVNCAGLYADQVQALAFPTEIQLQWDSAAYLVLDDYIPKPQRILFHQAKQCGKGITAIPCTEGNLLISGVRMPLTAPFATTREDLEQLHQGAAELLPTLELSQVIRSFGAVRPNPHKEHGENIHDFQITQPAPGFYSLIGIKTPGLTCSNELGLLVAKKVAAHLGAGENLAFDPHRSAIVPRGDDPDYFEIVCQCEKITRGEILEAIRRGATTVQGVKHRTGATMGRCQGSRCGWKIAKILKETGVNPNPQF